MDQHLLHEEDQIEKQLVNLNPQLKSKLKLDFTSLQKPKAAVSGKVPGLKLGAAVQQPKDQNVGFHEEFMARIEEFSLSWRQAAMNERKIP